LNFSELGFAASIFLMAEEFFYFQMQSPVGALLLAASKKGLYRVQFGARIPAAAKGEVWIDAPGKLREAKEQLEGYFAGELREFTLPLDLRGTAFQVRCWEALRRIPYGATRSYAQLAQDAGSPRAFRAVGQANHNNPIAIIVPCHRVIGADGTLTGYGGGLSVKERLLRLESGDRQALFSFAVGGQ
jgi:methylated-DNA-[protein]-cysteine S-methyltransferase